MKRTLVATSSDDSKVICDLAGSLKLEGILIQSNDMLPYPLAEHVNLPPNGAAAAVSTGWMMISGAATKVSSICIIYDVAIFHNRNVNCISSHLQFLQVYVL